MDVIDLLYVARPMTINGRRFIALEATAAAALVEGLPEAERSEARALLNRLFYSADCTASSFDPELPSQLSSYAPIPQAA